MYWNRFPLLRLLIPVLAGMLIAINSRSVYVFHTIVTLALFMAVAVFSFYLYRFVSRKVSWLFGLLLTLTMLVYGYQLAAIKNAALEHDGLSNMQAGKEHCMYLRLTGQPEMRAKTTRAEAEVKAYRDSAGWHSCRAGALFYFQNDTVSAGLSYGDELLVSARLNRVQAPLNPGEFNYSEYLRRRQTTYQAYVTSGRTLMVAKTQGNLLKAFALKLRQKLLNILKENHLGGNEYAVVAALLLGYKEKIDADLLHDYSGTGAMHILSVSGLHVGIVYLVFSFMLSFLKQKRGGRLIRALLLLMFVWFYALLTGLSPSVLRASAMLSFIIVGESFRQPANIYNSIAGSALLLLAFNPYLISDVGFQLSYMAVLGIVSMYPLIYRAWKPKFYLTDKIWSLLAVSLAAQIATFPLGIYYFNQFPNYFLLTNIVAVPLATLIIYAGIAVLITSFIPLISELLAQLLVLLLKALNYSVSFIESLPASVSDGLYIDFPHLIILYLMILMMLLYALLRQKKWLITALALCAGFFVFVLIHKIHTLNRKELIVYHIRNHTAIDFTDGNKTYFIADSALIADQSKIAYHIAPGRLKRNIDQVICLPLSKSSSGQSDSVFYAKYPFVQFADIRFAVYDDNRAGNKKLSLDYLLLTGNPECDAELLEQQYEARCVIMDGSNSLYRTKKWQQQLSARGISIYSTAEQGAFIAEIHKKTNDEEK